MTRNPLSASPTTPARPLRALSAAAALLFSLLLAPTAAFADETTTSAAPAAATAPVADAAAHGNTDHGAPTVTPVSADPVQTIDGVDADQPQVLEADNTLGMAHDLSPWGMYQNADIIVKIVMIGLAIASIITWTIWIAKGFELMAAKRRLRTEIAHLKKATTLKEASATATKPGTLANLLVHDALEEQKIEGATLQHFGSSRDVLFRLTPKEGVKVEQQGNEVLAAAKQLEQALNTCPQIQEVVPVQTNIVVAILKDASQRDIFIEQLKQKGILCMAFGPGMIRMVTHLDITAADCEFCIETLQKM